jgi:SAM-dependent methyltransferase
MTKHDAGWDWNRALQEMPGRWTEVADELFSFSRQLRAAGCRRVYDLGCGAGRHSAFLALQGFEVTASDVSASALATTRAALDAAGVDASLQRLDMADWPFDDEYFDALVAFNVVYHATCSEVESVLAQARRVLAPGGLLFVTLKSTLDAQCGEGRELAPFTWAPAAGIEAGVAHYYADEAEARRLLRSFDLISMVLKQELPVTGKSERHRAHWVIWAQKPPA